MAAFFTVQNLIALLTLTALEIVLGIDNVIFIAILAGKLPASQQNRARETGIALAVITRILLLLSISWVLSLTSDFVVILGHGVSGHDLILLVGGAFLIAKSTYEIHEKLEAHEQEQPRRPLAASFWGVVVQIVLVDIIFSIDSVVTAVGISGVLAVMIPAIVIAAGIMMVFSGYVAEFVEQHPTMKILALAFLILIGTMLVIEGWNAEVVKQNHLKNYVYFAMAFSFAVELLNLRYRRAVEPVQLHNRPRLPDSGD